MKINPYTKLFLRSEIKLHFFILIGVAIFLWITSFWVFISRKEKSLGSSNKITFITLTNFSPSRVNVVWKTQQPVRTHIIYGEDFQSLTQRAEDQISLSEAASFHYAELKNLKPKTTYYFLIWDGSKYVGKDSKMPFSFTTPAKFSPTKIEPVVAKLSYKGKPVKQTIVLLDIEGLSALSTLTSEDGSFVIPLSLVFDSELKARKVPSGKESFTLKVIGNLEKTIAYGTLEALLSYTGSLDIGNIYSFNLQNINEEKPLVVKNQNKEDKNTVYLAYPQDKAVISELNPLIRGTGIPGKEVIVEILGPVSVVSKTIIDEQGDWWVDLIDPLPPAEYKIVVNTVDEKDNPVQITRNFTITKAGESILGEATEEAAITPTPTPTSGAIASNPTPTPTPTIVNTPTPEAQQTSTLTPTQSPPVSGFNLSLVIIASFVAFLVSGVLTLMNLKR